MSDKGSNEPIDTGDLGPAEPESTATPFDLWLEGEIDYNELSADDKKRADRLLGR